MKLLEQSGAQQKATGAQVNALGSFNKIHKKGKGDGVNKSSKGGRYGNKTPAQKSRTEQR